MVDWADKFTGALVGGAVGDSVGLPREGLAPGRARRMFGGPPLRHKLILGMGMCSDDTEHACMTGQALLASEGNVDVFARSLAWRMRGWLLGVPAGIGLATLRSILKMWIGFGPGRSGVKSAGNGAAMRAAVIGVWAAARGATSEQTAALVRASTRLTHTDERAREGAMVVAQAAAHVAGRERFDPEELFKCVAGNVVGEELKGFMGRMPALLKRGGSTEEYVESLGLRHGVTGYVNHTVPVAIYCVLRWPGDFRRVVEDAVMAGGDTDTVGAIAGGIAGAATGEKGIPAEWVEGIMEWPRSVAWMRRLGRRLGEGGKGTVGLFWPGIVPRNLLFTAVVLGHGVRRMLPPYRAGGRAVLVPKGDVR